MTDQRHSEPNTDTDDAPGARPDRRSTRKTPRWLNVFGIIALVLILLLGVWLLASGGHGPGRHMPSGDAGGHAPVSIRAR